jgi:hypothetical protein
VVFQSLVLSIVALLLGSGSGSVRGPFSGSSRRPEVRLSENSGPGSGLANIAILVVLVLVLVSVIDIFEFLRRKKDGDEL